MDRTVYPSRVKAALCYGGYGRDYIKAAKASGLSRAAVVRVARPRPQDSPATLDELFALADACDVPRTFMVEGWEPMLNTVAEDHWQRYQISPPAEDQDDEGEAVPIESPPLPESQPTQEDSAESENGEEGQKHTA